VSRTRYQWMMSPLLYPSVSSRSYCELHFSATGPALTRCRRAASGHLRRWPTLSHGRTNVGSGQTTDLRAPIMSVASSAQADGQGAQKRVIETCAGSRSDRANGAPQPAKNTTTRKATLQMCQAREGAGLNRRLANRTPYRIGEIDRRDSQLIESCQNFWSAPLIRRHDTRGLPRSVAGRQDRRRRLLGPIQAHHHPDRIVGCGQPVGFLRLPG
jgi:hypothetical protein